MEVKSLSPQLQELVQSAIDARQYAHCPYSNFPVGAAVMSPDGNIYTGCNMENASYGLSVCAERNAMAKAVSNGRKKFVAAAISANIDEYVTPCGVCRQVFAEFGLDTKLYLIKPDMTYKLVVARELLPMAFTPESLDKPRA